MNINLTPDAPWRYGARLGFTLIELMIAIAIVAILAAIALPAYLDYTTRAKISEGLVVLDGMKLRVEEVFYTEGWLSDTALPSLFGDIQTNQLGRYINTANFYEGDTGTVGARPTRLSIIFNENVAPVTNRCVGLTSSLDGGNNAISLHDINYFSNGGTGEKITWVCRSGLVSSAAIAQKYLPTACRGTTHRSGATDCVH